MKVEAAQWGATDQGFRSAAFFIGAMCSITLAHVLKTDIE
jgi:hypothetical protein